MSLPERVALTAAALAATERGLVALLEHLSVAVAEHPTTAIAFRGFHAAALDNCGRLAEHLSRLGAPVVAGRKGESDPGGGAGGSEAVCPGGVSRALRRAYLAFSDAAVGYTVLHETAHVSDSTRYAATLQLAERHLRTYAAAAQEITQRLTDVVAWELRRAGDDCACRCPSCELGICWCVAHTTEAVDKAWRETAPVYPAAGLRVVPNRRRPADLDIREGDVVIAIDGRRVATTADVTAAVVARAPGETISIAIERPGEGALEVTARRR
jgi:hypothetical protein